MKKRNKVFIFARNHPVDPACILKSGLLKRYKRLAIADETFVWDGKEFLDAKIAEMKFIYDKNNYVYKVKTKAGENWVEMKDFMLA
jgi:hypothetical protein